MKVNVQIIHAFVDNNQGGNPAGVVLEAERLTAEQKLKIASEVSYSETAFVSPSTEADFKLEFFTPVKQIPHCGHATIATFSYLYQTGKLPSSQTSKETIDGVRQIRMRGEQAFMEQKAPYYAPVADVTKEILASLNITKDDLLSGKSPLLVNTGNSFLMIPLQNRQTLQQLKPDFERIARLSEQLNVIGYYAFSLETHIETRDASARMFGPYYGIYEEAATGMAAGPLACYLHDKLGIRKEVYLIEQGYLMDPPSPSLITVELEKQQGSITRVMVGGKGHLMQEKIIEL